ncbi:MAG: thiamine pyrophosphate-dependent enzyme [Hyphomicrobium sp.]
MRTGGQLLVDQLALEDVAHVFTVPGESFIAALDAMRSGEVLPVTTRHEGGAAMMAAATAKLTNRLGVALVTRGPGAANAAAGVYLAAQDHAAMLLLVGLPPRAMDGPNAFQAIDLSRLFGGIAKHCAVVPDAARMALFVNRAADIARSARRGPVVLGLPEDVLFEVTEGTAITPTTISSNVPSIAHIDRLKALLIAAERPLVIIANAMWDEGARIALQTFAQRFDLPVAAAFRRQDHIDNRHPSYAGHLGFNPSSALVAGLKASDLIVVIGDDLDDVTTGGYRLIDPQSATQRLITISDAPFNPASPYRPIYTIAACPLAAMRALTGIQPANGNGPWPAPWRIWRRDLRRAYEAANAPRSHAAQSGEARATSSAGIDPAAAMVALGDMLPADAIVCSGAGNYAAFLHRHVGFCDRQRQLAPKSGSMGFGLPAAIAAKLAAPGQCVVAIAGDGCLQMTGQELATAVQFGLPIIIIVANNAMLGTIRMHQERQFPGRVVATDLVNPDFVALAAAYGIPAERADTIAGFRDAFQRAHDSTRDGCRPYLIELAFDRAAIAPDVRIDL